MCTHIYIFIHIVYARIASDLAYIVFIHTYMVAPMTLHPGYSRTRSGPKVRTPTGGWISAPGKEGAVLLSLGAVFSGGLGLDDEFLCKKTLPSGKLT